MNSQEKTIQRFYEGFIARDAEGMAKCYHPEVVFSDPCSDGCPAAEATGMWRMLCARAQGLAITFSSVSASGDSAPRTGKQHTRSRRRAGVFTT